MKLVEIEVKQKESITQIDADYIILKNQFEGVYGPERSIDEALDGLISSHKEKEDTCNGSIRSFTEIKGISARGIVLIGIGAGFQIHYKTIEMMCQKAIEEIAERAPGTKVIATVSHGVGFGLDQKEVFLTQILNFKSALEKHKTLNLDKIIFNEIHAEYAIRLEEYMKAFFDKGESFVLIEDDKYYLQLGEPSSFADQFAIKSKKELYAFITMPFAEEFENVYDFGIRMPVEEYQLQPIRTDKQFFSGPIIEEVKKRILESRLVIADISTSNPNVMFELGFAEGCGKSTVIICQLGKELPFDVAGMNIIYYNPHILRELNQKISEALKKLL